MIYKASDELKSLAEIFKKHSYSLYLVGGAVRDYIRGSENHDYDLTTSALPEEVKSMFKKTIDTGIKHGTVTVIYHHTHYEITTFRTEGDYSDKRHPDSVTFIRSLEEDLKRRDFTINALAADIITGEVIDNHNGIEDLKSSIIRAIGNAKERFNEDALRMLRAARFSSQLNFEIEENTLRAMTILHQNLSQVSSERIKEELDKILLSPHPLKGIEYMLETCLFDAIIPAFELSNYQKTAIEKAKKMGLPLCSLYAILFNDLPRDILDKTMENLKFSNAEKKSIKMLLDNFILQTETTDDVYIREKLSEIGRDNIKDLLSFRRALGFDSRAEYIFEACVNYELDKNVPLEIKDLAITGEDISDLVDKGPRMGRILKYLLKEVIKNPSLNTKEELRKLVKRKIILDC